jgi:hypothetical protein
MPGRLVIAFLTALCISGAARAAPPPTQLHGAICTPAGCTGAAPTPAATPLAFAAAALAAGILGRRHSAAR